MVQTESYTDIYLEFVSSKSYKFYQMTISNQTIVTITYGCIGHTGTTQTKSFNTSDEANKFFNWQLKKKVKGGYKDAVKGQRLPKLKPSHPNQLPLPFY